MLLQAHSRLLRSQEGRIRHAPSPSMKGLVRTPSPAGLTESAPDVFAAGALGPRSSGRWHCRGHREKGRSHRPEPRALPSMRLQPGPEPHSGRRRASVPRLPVRSLGLDLRQSVGLSLCPSGCGSLATSRSPWAGCPAAARPWPGAPSRGHVKSCRGPRPGRLQVSSWPGAGEGPGRAGKRGAASGCGNPVIEEWVRGGASGSAPPEPKRSAKGKPMHSVRGDRCTPQGAPGRAQRAPFAPSPDRGSPLRCPVLAGPCLLQTLGPRTVKEATEWDWIWGTCQRWGGRQAQSFNLGLTETAPLEPS